MGAPRSSPKAQRTWQLSIASATITDGFHNLAVVLPRVFQVLRTPERRVFGHGWRGQTAGVQGLLAVAQGVRSGSWTSAQTECKERSDPSRSDSGGRSAVHPAGIYVGRRSRFLAWLNRCSGFLDPRAFRLHGCIYEPLRFSYHNFVPEPSPEQPHSASPILLCSSVCVCTISISRPNSKSRPHLLT